MVYCYNNYVFQSIHAYGKLIFGGHYMFYTQKVCPTCDGKGHDNTYTECAVCCHTCLDCLGSGMITVTMKNIDLLRKLNEVEFENTLLNILKENMTSNDLRTCLYKNVEQRDVEVIFKNIDILKYGEYPYETNLTF